MKKICFSVSLLLMAFNYTMGQSFSFAGTPEAVQGRNGAAEEQIFLSSEQNNRIK